MHNIPTRLVAALPLLFLCHALHSQQILVPTGAIWKYLDNGSNQSTPWRQPAFNDSTWNSGPAQLGYGDSDEATVVGYGPDAAAKYITTYFRHGFNVADLVAINNLSLRLLRDDGAVVYLNGTEVFRSNMPGGTMGYTTLASTAVGGADESAFYTTPINTSFLVTGNNVLAVELHQANGTSSDLGFDLELKANAPATISRGPYLQLLTPSSVIIRWRTDMSTATRLRYGPAPDTFTNEISNGAITTEHIVQITGLTPDATHYYQAGTLDLWFPADANNNFVTAPPVGTLKSTRVWVLGDSGTADALAAQVRDGFFNYTGARWPDLWLMLGDNAYQNGTDAEYQNAVFNMYPTILRNRPLWPTIGNHDTAGSVNPAPSLPYFQMFNLPTSGEAGGVSSGTEKYYSFDYGQTHFICLDSMSSARSAGGPMYNWLQNDLLATTQPWIIAFFHHPPYSRGSHNSDPPSELSEMRQNMLPLLEAGGVDLVLAGHSHSYERSFLLDGHYGTSGTLTSVMIRDGGSGRVEGSGAYVKPAGSTPNNGAVYSVAGSSGKLGGGTLDHPAMFISLNVLGSLVLDVLGERLDAAFVDNTGAVRDHFTILKESVSTPPPAAPDGLMATTVSSTEIALAWTDHSDNEAGFEIERSIDGATFAMIGLMAANVTSGVDQNLMPETIYYYRVRAFNAGGYSTFSAVDAATTLPAAPPSPPTGLTAVAGNARVDLWWTASSGATSYNIKRSTTPGSSYVPVAVDSPGTSYTDLSVMNGVRYYYVVSANNAAGEGANSAEVSALPLDPPAAPANASAVGISTREIQLSWQDNANNEAGYRIERSDDGLVFVQIAETAPNAVNHSDTGLVPNTTYQYRIRAFNSSGDSTSVEAVGSTLIPAAPATLSAVAGDGIVQLFWDAAAQAESYTVKRGVTAGGPYSDVASDITSVSYTDSGVQNDSTYYYVVVAVEVGVQSANSPEASATPLPLPPSAPTSLTAQTVSFSQVDLTWTDTSGNETSFSIERSGGGGGVFLEIATASGNATSFSDNTVQPASAYVYRVRALNASGASPYSNEAGASTPPAPPDAPSALVATAVAVSQIDLSWMDNSANETGFSVERSLDGTVWTQAGIAGANASGFADTGLAQGTTHFYRVRAFNDGGSSAFSATAQATTASSPIDDVVQGESTVAGALTGTYVDTWTDDNTTEVLTERESGGKPTARYSTLEHRWTFDVAGGNSVTFFANVWASASSDGDSFAFAYSIDGLNYTPMFIVNGTQDPNAYRSFVLPVSIQGLLYVRVQDTDRTAGNRAFDSLFVDLLYVRSQPGAPMPAPNAPVGLTASAVNSSQIHLAWVDQSSNEDGFKIERSRNGTDFTPIATVGASITAFEDTGLEASATYYYRVRSFNSGADSDYSNITEATTPPGPPQAPSGLTATALSKTEIALAWSDNSGNEANFLIERSTDGVNFSFVSQTTPNVTAYTDTGLTGNRTYYYRVQARNAQGASAFSNVATAKTLKR